MAHQMSEAEHVAAEPGGERAHLRDAVGCGKGSWTGVVGTFLARNQSARGASPVRQY